MEAQEEEEEEETNGSDTKGTDWGRGRGLVRNTEEKEMHKLVKKMSGKRKQKLFEETSDGEWKNEKGWNGGMKKERLVKQYHENRNIVYKIYTNGDEFLWRLKDG